MGLDPRLQVVEEDAGVASRTAQTPKMCPKLVAIRVYRRGCGGATPASPEGAVLENLESLLSVVDG